MNSESANILSTGRWGRRAVEPIAYWLDQVGLSQYATAFVANEITLDIAATLTEADLRELGVIPLGHRRRFSAAIAALRKDETSARPTPLERRHLTVMFCDLVGSTRLSTTIDPEDMAGVIAKYEQVCSDIVARHGGFVARYVGDGILSYFGYPVAHEDSAERAIRASLAIVKEMEALQTLPGLKLRVRIGVASGPVVVGDVGDRGANRDAVIGQTPNLAARLQGFAEENDVVVADSTYRLAGSLFRCSLLDNLSIPGFPEPIKAWRIVSERRYRGRFEARRKEAGLTPFVGRDSEFEALAESWREATERGGRVVLVTGEAGIGKSRLVRQFIDAITQQRHGVITFYGSSHLQNSPLRPVVLQLEREAQIGATDTPEMKRVKLEALLASTPALAAEAAPILSALLSLQRDPGDPNPDPDAKRRKLQTLDILVRLLEERSSVEPIVCVCEDVHWFDPTSCELLDEIIARVVRCRILMILTFRPEFKAPWAEGSNVQTMCLERLSPTLGTQIVDHVAAKSGLSPETTQLIVSKCDGIPLFIEELTKTVLQSRMTPSPGRSDTQVAIPDSLQDSLVARLDRLPGVKEIAQIGAALGREFRLDILESVSGVGAPKVNEVLSKLVDAELIEQRDGADGPVGMFKHALVQDAVYGTLLHAKRRNIHRRIAEVLEEQFAETCEGQPEVLALHWEKADVFAAATQYYTLAGKRAASRSATTEASMHLRQALRNCDHMTDGMERDQLELEAALHHGGVLRATQGPHSVETGKAFGRARDICLRTGNDQSLFPALSGLFGYYFVGAQNGPAEQVARNLLEVAEEREDRFHRMVGHRAVGMVHLHTGNPRQARVDLERSLELYDVRLDGPTAFAYGTDHAQTAASFLALTLEVLGYSEQAYARETWAIAHGTKLNHRYSLVQTAMFRIMRNALARNWNTVRSLAEETYHTGREHGFPLAAAMARFYLAVCRAAGGETSADLLQELDRAVNALGGMNYHPYYLSLIAEAHAASGDVFHGLKLLSEAKSMVDATQESWICSELLRLRGEMTLVAAPSAFKSAENLLEEAVKFAEQQGARNWHLRAVASLALLLARTGRVREARNRLAPLCASFTEGFASPDFRRAHSLLNKLSGGQRIRELTLHEKCSFW